MLAFMTNTKRIKCFSFSLNFPPQFLPEREPLQLPCELLLLPRLSPLVRMEMPEKLLALVTGGRRVRLELSESVLLQGRGSRHFMSLSVLLWRLLDARLELSRFPLREDRTERKKSRTKRWNEGDQMGIDAGKGEKKSGGERNKSVHGLGEEYIEEGNVCT